MSLTSDELAEVGRLLDVCFEFRGEYILGGLFAVKEADRFHGARLSA